MHTRAYERTGAMPPAKRTGGITAVKARAELQRILANAVGRGGHIDDVCEAGWVLVAARAAPKIREHSAAHGDAVGVHVGPTDNAKGREYGSRCFRVVFADTASCSISTQNLAQALARPSTAAARRSKDHLDARRRAEADPHTDEFRATAAPVCAHAHLSGVGGCVCGGPFEVDHCNMGGFAALRDEYDAYTRTRADPLPFLSWHRIHARLQLLCRAHHKEKTRAENASRA